MGSLSTMLGWVIAFYVAGAVLALVVAADVVRRAVKHGQTFDGFDALMRDVLAPGRAWVSFALIALGVVLTTVASILSLFLP